MTFVGPELPGTNFTIKLAGPDHIHRRGQNSPFNHPFDLITTKS
jgi:hypothetical protein